MRVIQFSYNSYLIDKKYQKVICKIFVIAAQRVTVEIFIYETRAVIMLEKTAFALVLTIKVVSINSVGRRKIDLI